MLQAHSSQSHHLFYNKLSTLDRDTNELILPKFLLPAAVGLWELHCLMVHCPNALGMGQISMSSRDALLLQLPELYASCYCCSDLGRFVWSACKAAMLWTKELGHMLDRPTTGCASFSIIKIDVRSTLATSWFS